MEEILFRKTDTSYFTHIELKDNKPHKEILLDTGSPITVISIPALLQITGGSLTVFRNEVDNFLNTKSVLEIGGYDTQSNDMRFHFVPYLINEIRIGTVLFKPFMFWVNITNYKSKTIKDSSILFGLDYINQGRKWFDENDDFHIAFENGIKCDTCGIGSAIKQSSGIMNLDSSNVLDIVVDI